MEVEIIYLLETLTEENTVFVEQMQIYMGMFVSPCVYVYIYSKIQFLITS